MVGNPEVVHAACSHRTVQIRAGQHIVTAGGLVQPD
jgi:hypothetical protein